MVFVTAQRCKTAAGTDSHDNDDKQEMLDELCTLGLFPNETANVRSALPAFLIDTRNGYLYATVEATAKESSLTNGWSKRSTVERSRRKTEREAFEKLLADFARAWPKVVQTYHTASR